MKRFTIFLSISLMFLNGHVRADAPVGSYIFPAGGQRGSTVKVRVGGLNLFKSCGAEILGAGVHISPRLTRTKTTWFEGPLLGLPDSQRQEDYPKDMAGEIKIAADAPLGLRAWRLWTSQGATPGMKFVIGDLPEITEEEIDGDPIPVPVKLPVTINGRIFPRANIDAWAVTLKKGQVLTCEVNAARLGSPLDARLEITDAQGKRQAESDFKTADPVLRFAPSDDGIYHVRIHDIANQGSQAHVYRLTLTTGPYIDRVFPLGGKRGATVEVMLSSADMSTKTRTTLPMRGDHHWTTFSGSNPVLLDLDDLEEVMETSAMVALPCVANGRISQPGETDRWTFTGKKGEPIELDLRAARLGSPLDGLLTLVTAGNKELVKAESAPPGGEPILRYTPDADGPLTVVVQDRLKTRGGPTYAYRLRMTKGTPPPNFRLAFKTDALTLVREPGKPDPKTKVAANPTIKLPITLERLGNFQEAVTLTVDGLPKGVTVSNLHISAKQNAVELIFQAEADTPIAVGRLTIRGTALVGQNQVVRTARQPAPLGVPEVDSVLLAVALPTPFKIKGVYDMRLASRGGVLERTYQIERTGHDGPIEVSLADKQARHLQGVEGPTILVPAGAKEFKYAVTLPPWMETGRTSRTCVMGVAVLKDKDGSLHEVSFSSTNQNEQLVAVVEPGKLGVNLDNASLAVRPGLPSTILVKVSRASTLKGDVTIDLIVPVHLRGILADKLIIPAGKDEGTLHVRCGNELSSTVNIPLVIRATLLDGGRPVVAETRVELVHKQ